MLEINNEFLSIKINPLGATLDSIWDKKRQLELLWQGDQSSWTGKDVTCFPFIGRLKDGYYNIGNKQYSMPAHGFCANIEFKCTKHNDTMVELVLEYDSTTLEQYPYKFRLSKSFELVGEKLNINMQVDNLDDQNIYFGIGGHPAIAIPYELVGDKEETAGNYILFPKMQQLSKFLLNEKGHHITDKKQVDKFNNIDLNKSFMEQEKTLLLTDGIFDSLAVVRKDGITIGFELTNYPSVLAFWSHPTKGGYICVEPWWGIPDLDEPPRELKDKPLINTLEINQSQIFGYNIIVQQ